MEAWLKACGRVVERDPAESVAEEAGEKNSRQVWRGGRGMEGCNKRQTKRARMARQDVREGGLLGGEGGRGRSGTYTKACLRDVRGGGRKDPVLV